MSLYRIFYTVKAKICGVAYSPLHFSPLKVGFDCTPASFKGVHLACRVICCRCLMSAPMIQNLRHMNNLSGLLHTPENKIIILCPVKFPAKSSNFLHKLSSDHKKMADVVVRAKKIQIKVRFQMRLKVLIQFCGHLVFICVHCICLTVQI